MVEAVEELVSVSATIVTPAMEQRQHSCAAKSSGELASKLEARGPRPKRSPTTSVVREPGFSDGWSE